MAGTEETTMIVGKRKNEGGFIVIVLAIVGAIAVFVWVAHRI